ncbi:MAG TPA: hypothetical protein VLM89_04275, partial [Phycisphaerae bacterium]|nr:hypothetical protein [Phycisphaerae bacterium]
MTVFSLLVLLVAGVSVVLAAAMFVFLFVKSGRRGRIIIGSVAVVFALLAVAVAVAFRLAQPRVQYTTVGPIVRPVPLRTAEQQRQADESYEKYLRQFDTITDYYARSQSEASEPLNEAVEATGVEKRDLVAAGFEPDIYASKEAAVRAVTRAVAKQYKAMIASQADLPRGVVIAHAPGLGGDGSEQASQAQALRVSAGRVVKKVFGDAPGFDVTFLAQPTEAPPSVDTSRQISLHLKMTHEPQPADGSEHEGTITGTIDGKVGRFTRQVDYLEKPWNDDFDRWRNAHEPGSWVLGESEDFCPERAQSIDQAMRSAATRLREPVLRQLLQSPGKRADWLQHQEELYRWLDQDGYRRLKARDFKTDVFTQEFKRPYGSVWRSAVLVHVPPEKIRLILDAYESQTGARRASMLRTLASAGGLLVLIVAVYGFLSAATRGYYV